MYVWHVWNSQSTAMQNMLGSVGSIYKYLLCVYFTAARDWADMPQPKRAVDLQSARVWEASGGAATGLAAARLQHPVRRRQIERPLERKRMRSSLLKALLLGACHLGQGCVSCIFLLAPLTENTTRSSASTSPSCAKPSRCTRGPPHNGIESFTSLRMTSLLPTVYQREWVLSKTPLQTPQSHCKVVYCMYTFPRQCAF